MVRLWTNQLTTNTKKLLGVGLDLILTSENPEEGLGYVKFVLNDLENDFFYRDTHLNHQTYLSASRSNDNVVFADANGGNFDNNDFVSSTPRHKLRMSPDHIQSPIDSTTQL